MVIGPGAAIALEAIAPDGVDVLVGLATALPVTSIEEGVECEAAGYAPVLHSAWETVEIDDVVVERRNTTEIVFPVLLEPVDLVGWFLMRPPPADEPPLWLGALYTDTGFGTPTTVSFGVGDQPRFPPGSLVLRLGGVG